MHQPEHSDFDSVRSRLLLPTTRSQGNRSARALKRGMPGGRAEPPPNQPFLCLINERAAA